MYNKKKNESVQTGQHESYFGHSCSENELSKWKQMTCESKNFIYSSQQHESRLEHIPKHEITRIIKMKSSFCIIKYSQISKKEVENFQTPRQHSN